MVTFSDVIDTASELQVDELEAGLAGATVTCWVVEATFAAGAAVVTAGAAVLTDTEAAEAPVTDWVVTAACCRVRYRKIREPKNS